MSLRSSCWPGSSLRPLLLRNCSRLQREDFIERGNTQVAEKKSVIKTNLVKSELAETVIA